VSTSAAHINESSDDSIIPVLGTDCHPEDVLLEDVGGRNGHDIAEFHQKHPNLPGRLILQDLPDAIASVKDLPTAVEPMAHDFFAEQLIKGKNFTFSPVLRS
jgi:hypothetical protein